MQEINKTKICLEQEKLFSLNWRESYSSGEEWDIWYLLQFKELGKQK